MLNIRWLGRGGQGAFTAARLLGQIATAEGKAALASPSFGPERRGAPVWSFTRIDDRKITDRRQPASCDYLVVLDESLAGQELGGFLVEGGTLILNTAHPEKYDFAGRKLVGVDATRMSMEIMGRAITNVAMLGALARVSGMVDLGVAEGVLQRSFAPAVYEKNKALLHRAFEAAGGAR